MRNPTTADLGTEPQKFLFRLNWPFLMNIGLLLVIFSASLPQKGRESNSIGKRKADGIIFDEEFPRRPVLRDAEIHRSYGAVAWPP